MCPGGVLQDPIPYTTESVRQTPTPTPVAPFYQFAGDRTAILRPFGWKNPHRNSH